MTRPPGRSTGVAFTVHKPTRLDGLLPWRYDERACVVVARTSRLVERPDAFQPSDPFNFLSVFTGH